MHLKPANSTICCAKHSLDPPVVPKYFFTFWQRIRRNRIVTKFYLDVYCTKHTLLSRKFSGSELLTQNICLACCRLHHKIHFGQQTSLGQTWHSSTLLVFVYARLIHWSHLSEHSNPQNHNSIFYVTVKFAVSTVPDQVNTRGNWLAATVNEMKARWAGFKNLFIL